MQQPRGPGAAPAKHARYHIADISKASVEEAPGIADDALRSPQPNAAPTKSQTRGSGTTPKDRNAADVFLFQPTASAQRRFGDVAVIIGDAVRDEAATPILMRPCACGIWVEFRSQPARGRHRALVVKAAAVHAPPLVGIEHNKEARGPASYVTAL